MKALVYRLYTVVFTFLREALRWYGDKKRKRLLNSFNQDFYEKFSDTLEEIRRIEKLIHTRGLIASHAELRDSHAEIKNTQRSIRKILSAVERVEVISREQPDEDYWKRRLPNSEGERRYALLKSTEEGLQTGYQATGLLGIDSSNNLLAVTASYAAREGLPEQYSK
jgi:hypothetical protein